MTEEVVKMDIPQSAVAAVTDFITKLEQKQNTEVGLCIAVKLPTFCDQKSWAVYICKDSEWHILCEVDSE